MSLPKVYFTSEITSASILKMYKLLGKELKGNVAIKVHRCVGRKIVVDTYGGVGRVGGGCFSSKNATKVDRSGAYYARYVAKNIVAHGFADEVEIQVAYAIGRAEPVSLNIECFDTNKVSYEEIYDYVNKNFSFRPHDIIVELGLLRPIFSETACYGHFGRDIFPWEKIKN